MRTIKCKWCNKKTIDKTSRKNKKFCSKYCRSMERWYRVYRVHRKPVFKICESNKCKNKFKDNTSNKIKKYCSPKCKRYVNSQIYRKFIKPLFKNCENCNKRFEDKSVNKRARFCKKDCQEKIYFKLPHVIERRLKYEKSLKRRKYRRNWENRPDVKKRRSEFKKSKRYKEYKKSYYGTKYKRLKRATPQWANIEKIKKIYSMTKKGYHVDHIIPLKNKNVCGLHVENNLRIISKKVNLMKNNFFESGYNDKYYNSKKYLCKFNNY